MPDKKKVLDALTYIREEISASETHLMKLKESFARLERLAKGLADEVVFDYKDLAVSHPGRCPFPDHCSQRDTCKKTSCNADTCSNGYAYRMS